MSHAIVVERSSRNHPCDLCGGRDFELISRKDRLAKPLHTVICKGCGIVSHESVPSDDEVKRYYANEYRQDYHGECAPSAHRILRAWEGSQWLLKLLRPYVATGSSVFEIGAGIGFNVKAFELEGFQAAGIEPGLGFHRFSRQALRAQITRESLDELPKVPLYDLILLVHVIEHFNSPRRAFEQIHAMLRPGGRVYVECPNLGAPHAAPSKLFHFAHIYNFTADTLVSLAESCGFELAECLTRPQGRALRYVFQRSSTASYRFSSDGYTNTLASLRRFSDWTYYARPEYLLHRLTRDVRFASNHLFPEARVRRLLSRLDASSRRVRAGIPASDGHRPLTSSP